MRFRTTYPDPRLSRDEAKDMYGLPSDRGPVAAFMSTQYVVGSHRLFFSAPGAQGQLNRVDAWPRHIRYMLPPAPSHPRRRGGVGLLLLALVGLSAWAHS